MRLSFVVLVVHLFSSFRQCVLSEISIFLCLSEKQDTISGRLGSNAISLKVRKRRLAWGGGNDRFHDRKESYLLLLTLFFITVEVAAKHGSNCRF